MSNNHQNLPADAPFSEQQKQALSAFVPTLSREQAIWLSGYFSGLVQLSTADGQAAPPAGKPPLTILFGSESGNAEACADKARVAAEKAGFAPKVEDMADYRQSDLAREENVLVIVSTWGEGDPPETAVDFHAFVMSEKAPSLKKMKFAVFALGDTSYAEFCECGKQFDKRFADLGATRILDRVDVDVDFEEPFEAWLKKVLPAMTVAAGASRETAAVTVAGASSEKTTPVAEPVIYGKKNPFPAEVRRHISLTGRGSAKITCHIELSLENSGLSYEPGDIVGVFPRNDPVVVEDLLKVAGYSGKEEVTSESGPASLFEVLESHHDITSLSLPFIKKYAPLAKNKELEDFLKPDNKDNLKDWLWGREIRDLLMEFPPCASLPIEDLLGILRKMPPRLYSIASSLRAHPDEVHLTVVSVNYATHGRSRKGVCSTFLCERIKEGDTVDVYTHHNKNFFLPENSDTPIIMIGPGTGIAPFRAFIEERAALGHKGKNWLFFGDQHFNSDFLYQLEWQDYMKKGILHRMDVAFSRDQDYKIYVQHRMKEKAGDLYAWMKEGAFFYVCGDANRMAKDVHQALIEIYAEQGGLAIEAAETEVKELQKSKRYQKDVY